VTFRMQSFFVVLAH